MLYHIQIQQGHTYAFATSVTNSSHTFYVNRNRNRRNTSCMTLFKTVAPCFWPPFMDTEKPVKSANDFSIMSAPISTVSRRPFTVSLAKTLYYLDFWFPGFPFFALILIIPRCSFANPLRKPALRPPEKAIVPPDLPQWNVAVVAQPAVREFKQALIYCNTVHRICLEG